MGKFIDLTGKKFGKLTVTGRAESIITAGKPETVWHCKCDCGKDVSVRGSALRSGHTKSCGCLQKETVKETFSKHGMSHSRIYRIYRAMNQRCSNKNASAYKRYGGRGIAVCEEWLPPDGFDAFLHWSMEHGYAENLTIERIDVNKGYSPENCCWIPLRDQFGNKENTMRWEYEGEVHTVTEWAKIVGIPAGTLRTRYYTQKWPIEKCLSTPVQKGFYIRNVAVQRGKRKLSVWIDADLLEEITEKYGETEFSLSEFVEKSIYNEVHSGHPVTVATGKSETEVAEIVMDPVEASGLLNP